MALRTDLVGRIDAVTARLTARRRILDSAARSGRAVTDDPGLPCVAGAERAPGAAAPSPYRSGPWRRSPRLARAGAPLGPERAVAPAARRRAAPRPARRGRPPGRRRGPAPRRPPAGVHAVHLPEGRRLASAVDALRERAAHPGGLPADLDTFRSEAAQLAASARTIAAFVGTTVPELAARPARLNEEPALTDGGRHEPPSVDDRSPSARAAMRAGERILNDPHCHPLLDAVPAFRTWVGAAVDACRAALGFHADARTLEERRRSLENSGPGWERRHREEADALAAAIARLATTPAGIPGPAPGPAGATGRRPGNPRRRPPGVTACSPTACPRTPATGHWSRRFPRRSRHSVSGGGKSARSSTGTCASRHWSMPAQAARSLRSGPLPERRRPVPGTAPTPEPRRPPRRQGARCRRRRAPRPTTTGPGSDRRQSRLGSPHPCGGPHRPSTRS